jgi:hypothetical protein
LHRNLNRPLPWGRLFAQRGPDFQGPYAPDWSDPFGVSHATAR